QTIWLVVNDLNRTQTLGLYGSEPIGLELQITIWAYNRPDEKIGQVIFKKYKIINKSGKFIEEMYLSQWVDPDLGDYSDDFCGCDTTLSLGFAYNGDALDTYYDPYGYAPPAVGYDFLQGPIVPSFGDTAIFDFKKVTDYKNLGMTSFGWFATGTTISDPILGSYVGALQWYNMLRGFKPFDDLNNPSPWTIGNSWGGTPTKFPLSGDPVNAPYSDRVDGNADYFPPGDRRIVLNSGPFDFAPGDTQEVVIAVIGGLAESRLSSLTELKDNSKYMQKIYDNLFTSFPKAPEKPNLKATPFEKSIMLQWGFDSVTVAKTENQVHGGYRFEGYNVYQLPKADSKIDEAFKIATYDVINNVTTIKSTIVEEGLPKYVFQEGYNTGIKRYYHIENYHIQRNYFTYPVDLKEGSTYHFAVTAYNYNNEFEKKFYETELNTISVRVQEELPGDSLSYSVSDTIGVIHIEGGGEGNVEIKVINPTETTGDEYEIYFTDNSDTTAILWNIINTTKDSIVVSKQEIRDDFELDDMPIFDGLQVKVSGPNKGLSKVYETDASDNIVDEGVTAFSEVNIGGPSLGSTGYLLSNRAGAVNQPPYARDWDRFGYWGSDDIEIDFSETSLTWDYLSEEVHFDSTDGSAYYAPFSVYRHTVAGDTNRLFAGFWDTDAGGTWNNNGSYWVGPIYGASSYEPIYCWQGYDVSGNEISYAPVNDATYISENSLLTSANNTWDGGTGDQQYPMVTAMLFTVYLGGPPIGNKVWFITNKPFTKDDKYIFTTIAPTIDDIELAKESVKKINVYPNPYYAHNSAELGEYITFTHLPERANIKIYNLAGIHITTLEHNDATSQFKEWDLTNGQNWLVASGM
ncbi:MAG: hypothetical protein U9N54_07760, partial [candidate division Zixibacteria bacterium]|nr:hypothetical protein [candidate division Zixibacteria bacterium]